MIKLITKLSPAFYIASCVEATRNCKSLAEAAGLQARLNGDAYLMGGEL